MRHPSHRLILAETAPRPLDDPWAERARRYLAGEGDDDVEQAIAILEADDQRLRGALEAYLLAGASHEDLLERFATDSSVLEAYRALCFDISGLKAIDRALVAQDPDVPDAVRQLRDLGFRHEAGVLDHVLGIAPAVDADDHAHLQQKLVGQLYARALRTTDLGELQKITGMITKLQPDQPEAKSSETKAILDQFIAQIVDPPVPRGLPDLESKIALPQKKPA